jgi:hypothetical protein
MARETEFWWGSPPIRTPEFAIGETGLGGRPELFVQIASQSSYVLARDREGDFKAVEYGSDGRRRGPAP